MTWGMLVFQLALGSILGSACATAALRSTHGESFVFGRSRCDGCGMALGFAATIPLVSYAHARGACSRCRKRIDPLHFVGELAGAVIVSAAFQAVTTPRALLICLLGFCLLATSVIDARTQRLPDLFTIVAACIGVVLASTAGAERALIDMSAAAVTFAVLQTLRVFFRRRTGDPGLGFGDVKLAAALALWTGPAICWALAIASLLGLLTFMARRGHRRLPFGPWIALASWLIGVVIEGWGGATEQWVW